MRRAIDDFIAAPVQPSANGSQDLGTIAGLTPLQPYRVAMGNPQVQELQTAVALKAAGLGIPKVANIGPVENATDNARYRPGARTCRRPGPGRNGSAAARRVNAWPVIAQQDA